MQDYGTDASGNTGPSGVWWNPDRTEVVSDSGVAEFAHLPDDEWEKHRARVLVAETAVIEDRQRAHHELNLWNAMLFSNRQYANFHWGLVTGTVDQMLVPANLVTENLIHSLGDAMLSSAASSPLKPTPVPRGASFRTRSLVRKLDTWVYGEWRRLKCEDASLQLFLDAYIAGTAAVRVYYDYHSRRPCVERVFFDNIIVDNFEMANAPRARTYRLRQVVPIDTVRALYSKQLRGRPLDPREAERQYTTYRLRGENWVPVVEAFRLPVGGQPGRHVVSCCGRLLVDEKWDHDWIPWVFFHWERIRPGFYSPSGLEWVVPYQTRLNELNEVIRDAQDLCSRARILQHAGSQIDVNAWDNVIGRIIKYTGTKPEAFVWETALSELYQERDRQINKAFEFFGRSQMTAQQQLPPSVRLDSSAAVREFRMQEDQRFLDLWTRFEGARMEIAQRLLDIMACYASDDDDYESVVYRGGHNVVSRVKWSEVRELLEDEYSWSMEAIPLSQQSPAARTDTLSAWVTSGTVSPEDARYLSEHPDLERIAALEKSSMDDIHRLAGVLETGKYEPPDPMQNLQYGITKITQNYLLLKQYDDVPESIFELHRRWIREAMALLETASASGEPSQGPQPVPGPAGAPLGPQPMAAADVGGALQPSGLPIPGVK